MLSRVDALVDQIGDRLVADRRDFIIMLRQAGWNSGRLHALHGDWRNLVLMWRLDGMSSMLIPEWAS